MALKLNDFFAGAGGMGLGFNNAGFEIVGAWDFDKYAVQSYAHNVGEHIIQADISKMTYEDVPQADVWTFGFPCQDLSIAGKQAGMIKGETRSGLFYEVMRLLEEVREHKQEELPKIIMAENVKALKKYLPVLAEEYDKAGYVMQQQLFNSKYWNVPQNRERYFVVGVRKDLKQKFIYPVQQTDFIPKLSSVLETDVDEKYYIDDLKATKIIEQAMQRSKTIEESSCIAVRGRYNENGKVQQMAEPRFDNLTNTLTSVEKDNMLLEKLPNIEMVGLLEAKGKDQVRRVYDPEGLAPTLTAVKGGGHEAKIIVAGSLKPDGSTRLGQRDEVWDSRGIAGCLNATDYKQPRPILHKFRVRKLTPREYARLQGFPDSFEQVVSNSQFYKQMGNAVTVTVSQAIAEEIMKQFGSWKVEVLHKGVKYKHEFESVEKAIEYLENGLIKETNPFYQVVKAEMDKR